MASPDEMKIIQAEVALSALRQAKKRTERLLDYDNHTYVYFADEYLRGAIWRMEAYITRVIENKCNRVEDEAVIIKINMGATGAALSSKEDEDDS